MALSEDAIAIIKALRESHIELEKRIAAMQAKQDQLIKGFPDGDPESHRRYHESIIEWRELRNKVVREALLKASAVGGIAAFGWVAYAVWQAIKMELIK